MSENGPGIQLSKYHQSTTEPVCPAHTRGPTGIQDQADPGTLSLAGSTPAPTGVNDYAASTCELRGDYRVMPAAQSRAPQGAASQEACELSEDTVSGSAPLVGTGVGAVTRIPVPGSGSGGLHIELKPRGYVPKSGSTSTLLIQDTTGKRNLRLDYGYNKSTGKVEYHSNQKGTHAKFGIPDHSTAGRGGKALYQSAKYFRYAGRVLLVVGAAADVYSIVVARKRIRQVISVAAGWGGARAGCKVLGAGGAAAASIVPGKGTAIGGLIGCIAWGVGGYVGASWAAGEICDSVEETFFEPVPEVAAPK